MDKIYQPLFSEFLEGGFSEEAKGRYNSAVSNYYKALTTLCSLIIFRKSRKISNSHQEVNLFLSAMFPEIRNSIDGLYKNYTGSYQNLKTKENCQEIKNGIQKVIYLGNLQEEFKEALAALSSN